DLEQRHNLSEQARGPIGDCTMFRDTTEQYHQSHHTLQAFTSLLTLVEALSTITEQGEYTSHTEAENAPPITLSAAGKSFAEIAQQVLDCSYVAVIALDPPDERQRLLGTSGLSAKEAKILYEDTDQTPMAHYVHENVITQLHNDQVAEMNLKLQPFLS